MKTMLSLLPAKDTKIIKYWRTKLFTLMIEKKLQRFSVNNAKLKTKQINYWTTFSRGFWYWFSICSVEEVLELAKTLLKHGIGGFFPTLVTDSVENIKRQIVIFKKAQKLQTEDMADLLGVHIEGIFLNPAKKVYMTKLNF